jgi:hypothetical protein
MLRTVRKLLLALALASLAAVLVPAASMGHSERASFFPDHTKGSVPRR